MADSCKNKNRSNGISNVLLGVGVRLIGDTNIANGFTDQFATFFVSVT